MGLENIAYSAENNTLIELVNNTFNITTTTPESTESATDKETLRIVRLICIQILFPIIMTVGLVGNTLNIVVLSRRWMISSTNYYLLALAIFDSLYLIFNLVIFLPTFDSLKYMWEVKTYLKAIAYIRPTVDIFSNCSIWLTVTFTVERYIGVRHPMKGKVWCTPQRARWICLFVFLTVFGLIIPEYFELDKDPDTPFQRTSFGDSDGYSIGYYWFNACTFVLIPLVLLFVFNLLLIRSVWQANKMRKQLAEGNSREARQHSEQQRITVMLISVVVVFIMCQLPGAILLLSHSDFDRVGRIVFGNISNTLVSINAAVNFILYSYFSARFRKTLMRMLCGWHAKKDKFIFSEVSQMRHQTKTPMVTSSALTTYNTTKERSRTPSPTTGKNGNNSKLCTNGQNTTKNGYMPVLNCHDKEVVGNYLSVV